jgi:hypothetical protein
LYDGKNGVALNFIQKSASPLPSLFFDWVMAVAIPAIASELLEIVSFSDVVADVAEMVGSISRAEVGEMIRGGTATGGAASAAELAVRAAINHLSAGGEPDEYTGPRLRGHRRIEPVERMPIHRRIQPIMPARYRTRSSLQRSIAAGRIGKAAKKSIFRKRLRKYGRANLDILSRGPSIHRDQAVVKRTQKSPAPVSFLTGASFGTGRIRNSVSKDIPDGSFSIGYDFKLSHLYNYTEFTDAYQWYKILYVKLIFYPSANAVPANDAGEAQQHVDGTGVVTGMSPHMCICPDSTSSALFSTMDEAQAHSGSVFHVFNTPGSDFSYYSNVKPTSLHGSSGSEVQTLGTEKPWVSTASATVPHYGLRLYFENFNDHMWLDVKMEMKVAFKGLKA